VGQGARVDVASRQQLRAFALRAYGPEGIEVADTVSDRWEAMTPEEREAHINRIAGGPSHA